MRRMNGHARLAAFLTVLAMLLAACGGTSGGGSTPTPGTTPTPAAKVKVALVTDIGGLNDRGFNQLAYTGYTKARNQYGFKNEVIQTQSQNDYVKNLRLAVQAVGGATGSGGLVVAVGFLMQTPLDQVAKQYPNVDFAIVDGCAVPDPNTGACETLANVTPLFFQEEQAGCLVGAIAGQMELDGKSKVPNLLGASAIGAVGGFETVPPVTRYIAGYKFCAKKVDPNVKVYITYSNDFTDTAKCKDAATAMINQHQVDIVFQVAGVAASARLMLPTGRMSTVLALILTRGISIRASSPALRSVLTRPYTPSLIWPRRGNTPTLCPSSTWRTRVLLMALRAALYRRMPFNRL
jgi:basic membrane protein A